jgi:hypothetical protein
MRLCNPCRGSAEGPAERAMSLQLPAVFVREEGLMEPNQERKIETDLNHRAMTEMAGMAGAATGAVVGLAIGAAIGGPIGGIVGCALCAATGALFGRKVGKSLIPEEVEEIYSMRTGTSAKVLNAGRTRVRPGTITRALEASIPITPPAGSGSPLAVSGGRFPARSSYARRLRGQTL